MELCSNLASFIFPVVDAGRRVAQEHQQRGEQERVQRRREEQADT